MKTLGIRTRVAVMATIVTVQLLCLVGTLGYLSATRATRDSQGELLEDRIEAVEAQLLEGGPRLVSQLGLDTSVLVIEEGGIFPAEISGTLQVVRASDHPDVAGIVGVVSTRQLDETFAAIRTGLFASILAIGLIVGAVAWAVVDRSLRPVRRLTQQARTIEDDRSQPLLAVGSSGDELAELAATFNDMITRLRATDLERRRFVSDASHELRTPLMVLATEADFVLSQDQTDDRELALSVHAQTKRLTTLVDDLLSLAAIDEGQPMSADHVHVLEVIEAANADELVTNGHQYLNALIPDLSRPLSNLISNAQRHSREQVSVSIEAELDPALLTVHVDDDGAGIPRELREQVFRRFARLDDGRARSEGGVGLGLAIAQADVLRAGGTISVGESPLGGARFSVTVPFEPLLH